MPDIRKFRVEVTQEIEVELDAEKFDEAFMEEFREGFYPFTDLIDHAEHIGQLAARGFIEGGRILSEFIEGYGQSKDMGISARAVSIETTTLAGGPDA